MRNDDVVTAMRCLPGPARRRIFDNLPADLRLDFAADLMDKAPVRNRWQKEEVAKASVRILKVVAKLRTTGEITGIPKDEAELLGLVLRFNEREEQKRAEAAKERSRLADLIKLFNVP